MRSDTPMGEETTAKEVRKRAKDLLRDYESRREKIRSCYERFLLKRQS
jgi:hypothetical protein